MAPPVDIAATTSRSRLLCANTAGAADAGAEPFLCRRLRSRTFRVGVPYLPVASSGEPETLDVGTLLGGPGGAVFGPTSRRPPRPTTPNPPLHRCRRCRRFRPNCWGFPPFRICNCPATNAAAEAYDPCRHTPLAPQPRCRVVGTQGGLAG